MQVGSGSKAPDLHSFAGASRRLGSSFFCRPRLERRRPAVAGGDFAFFASEHFGQGGHFRRRAFSLAEPSNGRKPCSHRRAT